MKALVIVLLFSAVAAWDDRPGARDAAASPTSVSFSVVNSGTSAYLVDGVANPTLTLNRGETYVFNVNAIGHPFYIKTARVTGSGSQYTSGVTGQGGESGQLTFVVP